MIGRRQTNLPAVFGPLTAAGFVDGTVTISNPDDTGFEVSGRVLTPDGHKLRIARLMFTDEAGIARTLITSLLGNELGDRP